MNERIYRTILKSITWKIVVMTSLTLTGRLVTGSWTTAAIAASTAAIVNIAVYYLHERVWQSFELGYRQTKD